MVCEYASQATARPNRSRGICGRRPIELTSTPHFRAIVTPADRDCDTLPGHGVGAGMQLE